MILIRCSVLNIETRISQIESRSESGKDGRSGGSEEGVPPSGELAALFGIAAAAFGCGHLGRKYTVRNVKAVQFCSVTA